MTQLIEYSRRVVDDLSIDLNGLTIVTEAGNGGFECTALMAGMAGAENIYACVKKSKYGSKELVEQNIRTLAKNLGFNSRLKIVESLKEVDPRQVDIVTNLGHVRPITGSFIQNMKETGVISLMWEPWEFREEDLDLEMANSCRIPVIGTNESNKYLQTHKAVGLLGLKLLFEKGIEVLHSKVLIAGSDPFGSACENVLKNAGSIVTRYDGTQSERQKCKIDEDYDAILVVEHNTENELIYSKEHGILEYLKSSQTPIVHICGNIIKDENKLNELNLYPNDIAKFGYMTRTTGYLGISPIIRLHGVGLLVGSMVARGKIEGLSNEQAVQKAVESGYGLSMDSRNL